MKFDTERKFGVEIEIATGDVRRIAATLNSRGVRCYVEHYNHDVRGYWKIVTDASCGYELVSPPLSGVAGLDEIRTVCAVLRECGARIDLRCGLHVHHDAHGSTDTQRKNLAKFYVKWEPVIDLLVSASRRTNRYCSTMNRYGNRQATLRTLDQVGRTSYVYETRYVKLNFESFTRYGTVEFRQHQATLNGAKMVAWIVLTQNIVTRAFFGRTSWDVSQVSYEKFKKCIGAYASAYGDDISRSATKTMDKSFKKFAHEIDPTINSKTKLGG